MTYILTTRQAGELHKSMIAYVASINALQSVEILEKELPVNNSFDFVARKKYEGLLARKWTNVTRLQRRILDLESRITSLESKLECASPIDMDMTPTNCLPGSGAKHTLQSHRAAVTCLAFHPLYPSVASASEDCSIKIGDREVAVLEFTLKGHSRPVFGLDFGGPQGRTLLASGSGDLTIRLWDPNTDYANVRTLHGHNQPSQPFAFSRRQGPS
ncbi:nuclear migration protein NudF [Penicillium sp. IBT 16267x]|nr:nuclear migration protein NudF [Penicillium sp. IBT 16267x]